MTLSLSVYLHFFSYFIIFIGRFQNRRAKWKRVKAGLTSHGMNRNSGSGSGSTKIVVPIPVHVNRFAVRSQHQHMEKMALSGPKPQLGCLGKNIGNNKFEKISGFERFSILQNSLKVEQKSFVQST